MPASGGGGRRRGLLAAAGACLLILVGWCVIVGESGSKRDRPWRPPSQEEDRQVTFPGEFERQEALLLVWTTGPRPYFSDGTTQLSYPKDRIFRDVVQAVWKSVQVMILVEDARSAEQVTRLLQQIGVPTDAAQLVAVPVHSRWIRDYGPVGVRERDGSCTLIAADYVIGRHFMSLDPHEGRLPSTLGSLLGMPVVRAPIAIEHGNLLSNGRGLCITTRKVLDFGAARGYDEQKVSEVLRSFYGAQKVLFLEPLAGELSGHVDMFATFPSPNTVMIAECSHEKDPANATILDRTAELLSSLEPPYGPLDVVRIPMPTGFRSHYGPRVFPTYTNVVYANDTLLMPVYPGVDPAVESSAFDLYRRLLPGWTVVRINATSLLESGGSLHCVVMNLPALGKKRRPKDQEQPHLNSSEDL